MLSSLIHRRTGDAGPIVGCVISQSEPVSPSSSACRSSFHTPRVIGCLLTISTLFSSCGTGRGVDRRSRPLLRDNHQAGIVGTGLDGIILGSRGDGETFRFITGRAREGPHLLDSKIDPNWGANTCYWTPKSVLSRSAKTPKGERGERTAGDTSGV